MKVIPITSYDQETVDGLLSGVPFFRDLKINDEAQYRLLLSYSNFYEAEPEEKVITKGQRDSMYYFLLRGQLIVYPDGTGDSSEGQNYIGSGQVFGALALLCDIERTASIVVDPAFSKALLFGTDFKPFRNLEDFRQIRLETKLAFYRGVVHHTRWKLEVYKMEYPDHPLVKEMKRIEFFIGDRGTVEELQSLDRQIKQITALLRTWNKTFEKDMKAAKEKQEESAAPVVSDVLHTG
jgi:hypothetical protein